MLYNVQKVEKCDLPNILKDAVRFENFKSYNKSQFEKMIRLHSWYTSHVGLTGAKKRINKLNEIFGKYITYTNKLQDISFSVRNAIWAFSYNTTGIDINDKTFIIYYSVEGLSIETCEDSKNDIDDILDFLIKKMVL